MSLLSVVNDVCAVVGVAQQPAIFAGMSANRTAFEMLALANEMAQRIATDTRDWTMLRLKFVLIGDGIPGWRNAYPYTVGINAVDAADGTVWAVAVAHNSPGSGTFAAYRTANPGNWTATVLTPGSEAFNLPTDYQRMLTNGNLWRSTQTLFPMRFFPDTDEWLQRRARNYSDPLGEWTIYGGQIHIWPIMQAAIAAVPSPPLPAVPAVTAYFPYLNKNCINLASGGLSTVFTGDGDTFRLPERILKLGMIWQWKANKGSPYAEDMGTWSDAMALAMGTDSPSPIIIGRLPVSGWSRTPPYAFPVPTP